MKVFVRAAAIWAAIGLAVSAYIHLTLAAPFDANTGTLVSQGGLFRIQAVVDVTAAALVVIRPRRWTGLLAAVVALGGLGLIVITVYAPLDLTALGLPYLYEPSWYQDKVVAAVAQGLAAIGALFVAAARGSRAPASKEA